MNYIISSYIAFAIPRRPVRLRRLSLEPYRHIVVIVDTSKIYANILNA
jgi:hypothetical protein